MKVIISETKEELGQSAGAYAAMIIRDTIASHGFANVILATGTSQFETLNQLIEEKDIDWSKVTMFHLDEYIGLPVTHPASFRKFLNEKIGDRPHPRIGYGVGGDAPDTQAELARYTSLLREHKPVVCVLGIGENGHLAFNDPPADFDTDELIHVVNLDIICRSQQVGEGHFATIDDVPKQALSLTVPALLQPAHVMALVPEARKAKAVQLSLEGPVTNMVPGSILRTKPQVKLYLDPDSASLLKLPLQSEAQ